MKTRILKVYCGEEVSKKSVKNLTPLQWVKEAKKIIENNTILSVKNNNPDFCSALEYLSKHYDEVEIEFYWNNKKTDLEELFSYFNLCYNELDSYQEDDFKK